MAWFDKKTKDEDVPEILKGKSAAEVAEALKKAEENDKALKAMQTERENEKKVVEGLQTEFKSVKDRLAAAEANNNQNQNQNQNQQTFEPDFVTDPVRSFQEMNKGVTTLAVHGAVNTARILAQQTLDNQDLASPQDNKTMDGRLFRAWEKEITEMSKKYQPIQLTVVDAWLGIFYYVKGTHTHELMSPETRKQKYSFLEPARDQAPPPQNNQKKDGVEGLTDEEKRRAELTIGRTQNLKPAEAHKKYAERKAAMQFVQ